MKIVFDVGTTLALALALLWQPTTVRRRGLINVTDANGAAYIPQLSRRSRCSWGHGEAANFPQSPLKAV